MICLSLNKIYYFDVFIACKGCGLVPIYGTLNDHGLCCGCHYKRKCRMCRRYLDPHLYSDGDGSICNACVKKSTQRGGATAYKALGVTTSEHVECVTGTWVHICIAKEMLNMQCLRKKVNPARRCHRLQGPARHHRRKRHRWR